jgi:hypothetical protein
MRSMAFNGTQDVVSVRARAIFVFFSLLPRFFFSEKGESGKNFFSFFFTFWGAPPPKRKKDEREEKLTHSIHSLVVSSFFNSH